MFDTEKFIEEIEKRPAIYDVNCSEYNDRNAKMTAWDEVCQVMVPNWARLTDEERNVEGIPASRDRSIRIPPLALARPWHWSPRPYLAVV